MSATKDPASLADLRRVLGPSLPVVEGASFSRCAVYVTLAEFRSGEWRDLPDEKTELAIVAGYNPHFRTIQTFDGDGEAEIKAVETLDRVIGRLAAAGWRLMCSPKTIDTDNHDWRRISRVLSPDGRRFSLIAWIAPLSVSGDWWMC